MAPAGRGNIAAPSAAVTEKSGIDPIIRGTNKGLGQMLLKVVKIFVGVAICVSAMVAIPGCGKPSDEVTYVVATVAPDGQLQKRSFPKGTTYQAAEREVNYQDTLIGIHPVTLPGNRKAYLWLIRDSEPMGLELDNRFYRIVPNGS